MAVRRATGRLFSARYPQMTSASQHFATILTLVVQITMKAYRRLYPGFSQIMALSLRSWLYH